MTTVVDSETEGKAKELPERNRGGSR
jgi:hypothetical protein